MHCRNSGCTLRPHAKTHKCPEVARRQLAAGARGISVATVPEAEAMVAAGIHGVLLTSPIVEVGKIARMVELSRTDQTLMLAVGHAREAELLAEAAAARQVHVNVLVDLDVGDHRTGSPPGQPALELARTDRRLQVASSPRSPGVFGPFLSYRWLRGAEAGVTGGDEPADRDPQPFPGEGVGLGDPFRRQHGHVQHRLRAARRDRAPGRLLRLHGQRLPCHRRQ